MRVSVRNRQQIAAVDLIRCRQLVSRILRALGAADDRLSVVLVDDATIADINRRWHATVGVTDVLAFEYGPGETTGEIIVSVQRAFVHARRFRVSPARELALYLVHGILHLHGYDDRSAAARRRMRTAERRLLGLLARPPGWAGLLRSAGAAGRRVKPVGPSPRRGRSR